MDLPTLAEKLKKIEYHVGTLQLVSFILCVLLGSLIFIILIMSFNDEVPEQKEKNCNFHAMRSDFNVRS
jgi:hypothetical protein